ncbi:e3 ubiquitin-protein ligase ubr7 [Holotrichia oblita]|uniref:E3 ubiquitin-protein ligase ubr7 n=1 Tax=Holotrichia oblita TaxID=644536 RepID=A0ACB9T7I2_HOLOL|nr:e3 ubiquitin-protein ligase ubr7 [Holotrichia oblita]
MENNAEDACTNDLSGDEMETVTLTEVAQSQQNLYADAYAVLGASDDKNCTYSEGYLKRQALYACLTCIPEGRTEESKRAGICLACTYHCHDGHDLVELYTKRNFRCDCGNNKFPDFKCNLNSDKEESNEQNSYNQNFSGVYCTCSRPYPDPDDPVVDEMIQCIICEDWYHTRHLGVDIPSLFAEMICENCVKEHDFLVNYEYLTITGIGQDNTDAPVDVMGDTKANKDDKTQSSIDAQTMDDDVIELDSPTDCKKPKNRTAKICTKFMKDISWRQQLCICEICVNMYSAQNVSFLTDAHDTVQFYEEKGKATALEDEECAINSVDRVPLMEAIAGYNDLKGHLVEYLKKFQENKKVVREEDIKEFFSSMAARKKQKTTVPYFCR